MFKHKLFALVYASALGISACAHDAWQPPASGHPADPAAQAGGVTPITSLERYRASQAETDPHMNSGMEHDDEVDEDGPAAHEHGDHMEESQ